MAALTMDAVLVDVRDMLCAQALARVAEAIERVHEGSSVEVLYNAEDVRHDLTVWAKDRGLRITDERVGMLRLTQERNTLT